MRCSFGERRAGLGARKEGKIKFLTSYSSRDMDGDRENQNKLQVDDSWIPKTPFKLILPKPQVIYTNRDGNLLDQANGLGPRGVYQETIDGILGTCLDSASGNSEADLEARMGIAGGTSETCKQFPITGTEKYNFTSLLALQHQASAASTRAASYRIEPNRPWLNGNYRLESQYDLPIPHGIAYDLNLPPGETVDSFSSKTTFHIVPVTPEKPLSIECRQVTEVQNLFGDERVNEGRNEENGNATTTADMNRLQTDRELQQPAKDSSIVIGSALIDEHQNPEKDSIHAVSLSETPQQKPRRKKHRPRVITEGKPRTPKPVTPKPAPTTESPTGKRKYVRKKPLNITPTTPPGECKEIQTGKRKYVRKKPLKKDSTTTPIGATGETANKSCRRSLNFDIEGQPGNNSSRHQPNSNEDSQPQIQDGSGGNQSKSTVAIGQGIEVMVEITQAGIPYDLADSVSQILEDYTSMPEKQTPSTSLPAKTYPTRSKRNGNLQEINAKAEHQVAVHTIQQNSRQIMLQADTQLPPVNRNGSNSSTCTTLTEEGQANGSKRKLLSFIQQPDTYSANLNGIHYNALFSYQKKAEKGQNSTTSTPSCASAAKDIVRVEIARPQQDIRGDPAALIANGLISAPCSNASGIPSAVGIGRLQCKPQTSGANLSQKERSTKKRSRGPTQLQDLASVTKIALTATRPTYADKQVPVDSTGLQAEGTNNKAHQCIEALVAEMHGTLTTKKRTKKSLFLVNSASSSTNGEQSQGKIILYNQNQYSARSLGAPSEVMWKQMLSINAAAEQLQQFDINRESTSSMYKEHSAIVPCSISNEQQNVLVLYRRDGTIVPHTDPFEPIKKRRPRPKVELDEETNRVWKLLMGNINSEGIDGTDEEKAKWWEEEREVFRGRANSFIARMHLVQGDRRFSQWKGSVVDSVIGVFLTQNVSDHLSSSAFMSMAARFPLKSKSNNKPCYEERTSSIIEKLPIICMPDLEDTVKWNEMSNQSICDQSSMTLHESELDEEREVVISNESSTSSTGIVSSKSGLEICYDSRSTTEIIKTADTSHIGGMRRAKNDALSSQNYVVLSQTSVHSPSAQTTGRKALSGNNSETEDLINGSKFNSLTSFSSFVELLVKAGSNKLHEIHSPISGTVLTDQNSKDEFNKIQSVGNDLHMPKIYNLDSPKRNSEVPAAPSNNCHSHLISNLGGLKDKYFKTVSEETRCYETSKNSRHTMKEQSSFTEESAGQITDENYLMMTVQASRSPTASSRSKIHKGKNMIIHTQSELVEDLSIATISTNQLSNNETQQKLHSPNLSGETLNTIESGCALNKEENNSQKTTESNMIEQGCLEIKEINEMKAATRKAKSRRVGKEIRDDINWDDLRIQAEANGEKRERTPNTMDSLDWEAVRRADVHEIAETIKERGMNNILAGRIKDFLNRMVREHGSIDLEWLRDIPPDKAKEYLLSIRGLGLKSVECVRLLTLHHLAFPVDTNVGRIAVRLGWVPLQPLPESLQLHLLELYPVLESIQKYLWPRLCKLDQRTLYELHYQMITFGKVFCTKSKPNCNACPMRGECRHFASAFASARLSLPGPEEKGIVSATESRTNEQNPTVMVEQPPLLLPQATRQSEENQLSASSLQTQARCRVSNCEPIVDEPSSPEPECTQVTENDMEDNFCEDPEEIPTIKLNIEEFTQNLQNYMQQNMELQEGDMSKALVALTAEAASIPTPKLKNVSQLRTEHHVYELPDSHPLLQGLDKREPDDPCSYLLAIWTPGETADSIQPPESRCNSQEYGKLCDEETCFSCNSVREANSQIIRGTLLIPCRTAMRGSFPLNGTYFQVNEVFADHDSSINPIDVPRFWIWNLPRRTVYFGTSIPTIFKGLTTEGIQHCFWRGYVCVRGFDQKTRAPRPLMARLHFPASKLNRTRGKDLND